MKSTYIKELDGIRGIAAVMVMLFHFFHAIDTQNNFILKSIQKISIFGQTGVTLFFVLSGFLITRILYDSRESSRYFSTFYIRRSLRIFPLYYFFLITYYFIIPIFKEKGINDTGTIWYFWVYFQNFAFTFNWPTHGPNHFWSLAVEEHFYLFWPIVVYFVSFKRLEFSIYFLIVVAFICRWILLANGYGVFYLTFTNVDALAIGALLAIKERQNQLTSSNFNRYRNLLAIFASLSIILWSFTEGKSLFFIQLFKFPMLSFLYFSLLALIVISKETWKSIFNQSPLQFSGKISYGLYVYHPLCFELYRSYFKINIFVDFILSFAVSYLIALSSYYLFEVRFINLKKYFNYQRKNLAVNS